MMKNIKDLLSKEIQSEIDCRIPTDTLIWTILLIDTIFVTLGFYFWGGFLGIVTLTALFLFSVILLCEGSTVKGDTRESLGFLSPSDLRKLQDLRVFLELSSEIDTEQKKYYNILKEILMFYFLTKESFSLKIMEEKKFFTLDELKEYSYLQEYLKSIKIDTLYIKDVSQLLRWKTLSDIISDLQEEITGTTAYKESEFKNELQQKSYTEEEIEDLREQLNTIKNIPSLENDKKVIEEIIAKYSSRKEREKKNNKEFDWLFESLEVIQNETDKLKILSK